VPAARRAPTEESGFHGPREPFEIDRVEPADGPAEVPAAVDREPAPRLPTELAGLATLPPAEAAPEPADLVPARFDAFGRGGAQLDGLELAELETGDELGEVEVLLSLTDLLCRPNGTFGPHPMRGELAGAGAGAVS
jgi:hypothetical protein